IIVSGNPVSVEEAGAAIDRIVEGDLVAGAVAFAREKAREGGPFTRVRDREDKIAQAKANLDAFDAAVKEATKKARGLEAPIVCAQAVRNGLPMDFDAALAREREYFFELLASDQSKAQRHLFFAEREAAKVPGLGKETK